MAGSIEELAKYRYERALEELMVLCQDLVQIKMRSSAC